MFLVNAAYLDQDFRLVRGDLEIEGGRIRQVGEKLSWSQNDLVVDCQGYTIVPGFVDVHIHGCGRGGHLRRQAGVHRTPWRNFS